MMVGCEVVARLHGVHRIDWARPPVWAAPWETNSMLVTIVAEDERADAASSADLRQVPAILAMPPRAMPPRRRIIHSAYMS